jgi:hypothetical protein
MAITDKTESAPTPAATAATKPARAGRPAVSGVDSASLRRSSSQRCHAS